ncbi:hypothetical protein K458DRAFT_412825 [Lentithecium fluviatile CBS 122367]|uniref:Uncharacterized protein n=1 Tax=Lentithecium fluviatile CBS 122367 TaxID=1168545 RepID=A0A6G1JIB0_9PLEO|nr:hypothetical protein K458DRAFT_412825 [Lentithecium fluviatile CBS 122367]
MTNPQKRTHIAALQKTDNRTNRHLRLTLPRSIVASKVAILNSSFTSIFQLPSASFCHTKLLENWQMKFDAMWAVPGHVIKPRYPESMWDPKLLSALAILSEMTIGQGLVVRRMVVRAVKRRGVEEMGVEDVLGVIGGLFECAGS